ncbi:hypothetical protein EPYR_03819 [Erwinia pyrifoliae DSM 12163]|nr:hypothetical protein EPYR_03819 [Erwinia pyrifoliae DSM 12163]
MGEVIEYLCENHFDQTAKAKKAKHNEEQVGEIFIPNQMNA